MYLHELFKYLLHSYLIDDGISINPFEMLIYLDERPLPVGCDFKLIFRMLHSFISYFFHVFFRLNCIRALWPLRCKHGIFFHKRTFNLIRIILVILNFRKFRVTTSIRLKLAFWNNQIALPIISRHRLRSTTIFLKIICS